MQVTLQEVRALPQYVPTVPTGFEEKVSRVSIRPSYRLEFMPNSISGKFSLQVA
jgi:hypothetical protein